MKDNKHINENELDALLRDLYLEENATTIHEKEADFVFSQNYSAKIDNKKEKELLNKLNNKQTNFGGFKFFLSILIAFAIIAFLLIYFISNEGNKNSISNPENNVTEKHSDNSKNVSAFKNNTALLENPASDFFKTPDTFGRPKTLTIHTPVDSPTIYIKKSATEIIKNVDNAVPYITEQDKARYAKVKEQILSKLTKFDKGLYTHIDANVLTYANEKIIVGAFTIRNIGITNVEYKTFLADLLIQKKHHEYTIAQVYNENWSKLGYTTLANNYFIDEKYNDFPVVNITNEGAKLFCKWLEEETEKYIQLHHLKIKPLQIRLPYDEEWIYAAREGYAKIAFEKGYNTIYDDTENLVDKSFSTRAELIKKRVKRIDTLYNLFTTNRYGWNEKAITDFFSMGFNYYSNISYADTIYVERMKIVGKIGRVSEIVHQRKTSKIWLTGLSWKNKEEYLTLENEFKTNLCSPFVGFRPVIINPSDPVYKNPFW